MISAASYLARTSGSALNLRLAEDAWEGGEDSRTLNRTFTLPYDYEDTSWNAYLPAYGAALASPAIAGMIYTGYSLQETGCRTAKLILTYEEKSIAVTEDTALRVEDAWQGVEGSRTLNRTFTIPYDHGGTAWESYIPDYGAPLTGPSLTFMLFDQFSLKETGPGTAEITLTYEQSEPDPSADPPTLPDDEVIESSTVEEIDIAAHPKFSTVNPAWGGHSMEEFWDGALHRFPITFPPNSNGPAGAPFKLADGTALPDALKGLQSYIVGTGQLRAVTYSLTRPTGWIASLAGHRTTPPSGYPGSAAKWLILSGDISPQNGGTYYAKSLVYQYSEKDWDSFIYDAV